MTSFSAVSVVMPVRNEAPHLEGAVRAVLDQDYGGPFEVVLAVGPSTDGTEDVAARLAAADPRVRVVPNEKGTTSAGLNAAVAASTGDVLVRVDGHAELSRGYVARAVAVLAETGAANVGGVQEATGDTPFERAVAAAMTSRFGVGDAKFHYGGDPGPADTVYLGVFRRDALEEAGGFDETLVRNQDYELNWRIRENGGTVWFDPSLRVRYRPRGSLRALARQYFQYGQWKREVVRRHPRSLRWRQVVPPVATVGVVVGAVAGVWTPWGFLLPAGYGAASLAASLATGARHGPGTALRLPAVFAAMHHAWGLGFLVGPRRRNSAAGGESRG